MLFMSIVRDGKWLLILINVMVFRKSGRLTTLITTFYYNNDELDSYKIHILGIFL